MSSLNQRLQANGSSISQLLKAAADEEWYVGQSGIQGKGVFAGKNFEKGEVIDVSMYAGGEDEFGAKIWNLTTLARYCNHQHQKNVEIVREGHVFNLVASKPIKQDEELFADYRQVTRAVGPNAKMLWGGEPIPSTDLEGYVEKSASTKKFYHSCCGMPAGECQGCLGNSQLIEKEEDEEARDRPN